MRRSLALGGFSGTGKSTVARALAARTGVALLDLDASIAARWGPIARQFAEEGEAVFRARETRALREAVAGPVAVIATGGGAWDAEENRRILAACWRVVLRAPLDELRRRIGPTDPSRPLWDAAVGERFAAREASWVCADVSVETAGRDPGEIAEWIAAWWAEADTRLRGG